MKFSSAFPRLQISLGPETAKEGSEREISMHTTAQEHTLRSLQAPPRLNQVIIAGAQGNLVAEATRCVKSWSSRLCLAMHLIVSAYMGWKGGTEPEILYRWALGVHWSTVAVNVLLASCSDHRVIRDSAARHLSETAFCTMPQQLLIDDTLHIEAKQIN